SPDGMWNRMEYRPLEGFIFAVTPFNFTAIAGNLPLAPALCGNVALWKPATSSIYSSYFIMKVLHEAGMPEGVINFLPGNGADVGNPVLESEHFAGLHFTGSTGTFQHLWKSIANNIEKYKPNPRIVGKPAVKTSTLPNNPPSVKAWGLAPWLPPYEYRVQNSRLARVS